jgi:hypothetical protein
MRFCSVFQQLCESDHLVIGRLHPEKKIPLRSILFLQFINAFLKQLFVRTQQKKMAMSDADIQQKECMFLFGISDGLYFEAKAIIMLIEVH